MRKLVIGIVAVALLGLLAVPAMAVELDSADVTVSIEVEEYGAIEFNPDNILSLTVSGPYVPGEDVYCGQINFNVKCNLATTLVVTAPDGTSLATAAPGEVSTDYYPHATGIDESNLGHMIGFGFQVSNLTPPETVQWNKLDNPDGNATISFAASLTTDASPYNASIYVESYMDSARGTDALAPPGTYTADLLLTLSAG